jgi:hypothetical protein
MLPRQAISPRSDPMNQSKDTGTLSANERRALPFFVEFVKFATGFAVIIATALIALHAAGAAMPG